MTVQRTLLVVLGIIVVLLAVGVGPERASTARSWPLPEGGVGDGLVTSAGASSAPHYQVETGTTSGGGYRLTTFAAQADTIAAGGAYRLLRPAAPKLHGSGCCCIYLPCIMRNR